MAKKKPEPGQMVDVHLSLTYTDVMRLAKLTETVDRYTRGQSASRLLMRLGLPQNETLQAIIVAAVGLGKFVGEEVLDEITAEEGEGEGSPDSP
jgi:hypothetical protein